MRIGVQKTLKMYVGGKFIRSESGRVAAIKSASGDAMYVCQVSRKDLRNTMEIARKAQSGWAGRTAYNKGQILYRLAEMIDDRTFNTSADDVQAAADRAVHYAGWTDKIGALLSSTNPVQAAYINYSHLRAVGVVLAVPTPTLTGMVDAICVSLTMGNSCMVLIPSAAAELATQLTEALATSDIPAGVVNVLTGDIPGALEHANKLDDLDAIHFHDGATDAGVVASARSEGARVLRRISVTSSAAPAGPQELQRFAEVQTVWMSS